MWQFWKMHSAIILACVLVLARSQNSSSDEYFSYDEYIVGGFNVAIKDAAYQVSVRLNDRHHCGGSIITQNKILTAAHCTHGHYYSELGIRVGSTYHYNGKYFSIREYKEHQNFNAATFAYDVCFLFLNNHLTFGATVKSIKYAGSRPNVGTRLFVTGWGKTRQSSISDRLLGANVPYISQQDCKNCYVNRINNAMLCAGYIQGGADSCQGDSGGPLINPHDGRQVGVVSWGFGCGEAGHPGVYASLPNIFKNMLEDTEEFTLEDSQENYSVEDRYFDLKPTYEYT